MRGGAQSDHSRALTWGVRLWPLFGVLFYVPFSLGLDFAEKLSLRYSGRHLASLLGSWDTKTMQLSFWLVLCTVWTSRAARDRHLRAAPTGDLHAAAQTRGALHSELYFHELILRELTLRSVTVFLTHALDIGPWGQLTALCG